MTDEIQSTFFSNLFTIKDDVEITNSEVKMYESKNGIWLLDYEYYRLTQDGFGENLIIVTLHEMDGKGGFVKVCSVTMFNKIIEARALVIDLQKLYSLLPTDEFYRCTVCDNTRAHYSDFAYVSPNKNVIVCNECDDNYKQMKAGGKM